MFKTFLENRFQDLKSSLITKPGKSDIIFSIIVFLIYTSIALLIGFLTGFLKISLLHANTVRMIILPFSLFSMPSFLEEILFRALLLPHKTRKYSIGKNVFFSLLSILAFIVWHPVNALTINHAAYPFFTNPAFLILAAFMAVACTITYLKSGSIWIPVIIHWVTVFVWVFFLGGRNLVLD